MILPDKSLLAQGLARGGEGPPPVPSAHPLFRKRRFTHRDFYKQVIMH
nr:MAG TPA: hypothetical protein [Caudoviricetes sp.]